MKIPRIVKDGASASSTATATTILRRQSAFSTEYPRAQRARRKRTLLSDIVRGVGRGRTGRESNALCRT